MSSHHTHHSHVHNFFNKHTAWAIFILVAGCFTAGLYVGSLSEKGYMREYQEHMGSAFHAYESFVTDVYYKSGFINSR
jgi:hypothetical protein